MRVITFFLIFMIPITLSSFDFGGAISTDYYNNPIEDSAPSPIQFRPLFFHNLEIGLFSLRSGFGVVEANYEITEDQPVFNDMYSGFYTLEFDIFTYPGISFDITKSISAGLSGGGGVRLPLLTGVDKGITNEEAEDSFSWFYEDYHYLFWGVQVFSIFKLPLSDSIRFFGNVYYKDFIFRKDQWLIGAAFGLLWHL